MIWSVKLPLSHFLFIYLLDCWQPSDKYLLTVVWCCGLKLLRYTTKKRENDSMCYDVLCVKLYTDYICWVKLTKLLLTPDHDWLVCMRGLPLRRPSPQASAFYACPPPHSLLSLSIVMQCAVNRLNKLSPRIRVYNFARILTSFATCFITFVLISSLAIYRQTIQA